MTQVKWLIEDFAPDNKFQDLADEVCRQGMECEVVKYEPFQSGSYNKFKDEDCVIIQSSINLALQLMRQKKWIPGPWLTANNYKCTTYYGYFGKYLFNNEYLILPRDEVRRKLNWLYECSMGARSYKELFFRPDSGLKPFYAGLTTLDDFESFWKWVEEFTEPTELVVISTPKRILGEWRFICADHNIITGCQYRTEDRTEFASGYPDGARNIANRVAAETFSPDPMYIIDVCQAYDHQYYLLEINSFSCGGLYYCEMQPIVENAKRIAIREYEEVYKI
jgi:hypothetical protein